MDEATKQLYIQNGWPLPSDYVPTHAERLVGPDRCYHCKQLLTIRELSKPLTRIMTAANDWNTGRFCNECANEIAFR